jgi:ABC-type transport system involved in multi-copper enzyme maturation permease subunit
MLRFLRSEIYRLRRRRMMFILLLFVALTPVLVYAVIYTSTQAQLEAMRSGQFQPQPGQTPALIEEQVKRLLDSLRPDRAPQFALGMTAFVGTVLATVLAGSVTGNEYGWATIRTVLAHGGRRGAFLCAKFATLILASAGIVTVGFAATFVGAYAVSIPAGLDLSLSDDIAGRTLGYMLRGLYVSLPYMAFALLVATLARSAAGGIAFGLVLLFGESLLSQLAISLNRDLRPLFDAGVSRNVTAVTRSGFDSQGLPAPPPHPGELPVAVAILALYVIAFVALAVHRLSKRDVTLA